MNKATLDNDIEMITIIHIYIFIYVRYKIMYFQFHNNNSEHVSYIVQYIEL